MDCLQDIPVKFRLKHNQKCSLKQKRIIRASFNAIQSDFYKKLSNTYKDLIAYGEITL